MMSTIPQLDIANKTLFLLFIIIILFLSILSIIIYYYYSIISIIIANKLFFQGNIIREKGGKVPNCHLKRS